MTKRILLVDDERSIRESLSKTLLAENYEVVLAENRQEAIEKHERIDLLILDLAISLKDGWDTFRALVEINPQLPVIIITGRSNQHARAESAGADALMEKPLDVPALLQAIRELLDEPMESRAQRASKRASGFRDAPGDSDQFNAMLLERFNTPYAWPGSEDPR